MRIANLFGRAPYHLALVYAATCLLANAQVQITLRPSTLPAGVWPTNTAGSLAGFAPGFGVSSAKALPAAPAPPGYKQEGYIPAIVLFPGGPISVNDIATVSYWTNKPLPASGVDWTFYIYTAKTGVGDTGSFYHSRLNSEPYFTSTPDPLAPPNQWHQWATNDPNYPMRFYDANRNGGIFGTYTDPTLAQLQAGPFSWPAPAAPGNSNDYRPEVIDQFSYQIGSCCGPTFSGMLDGITITLKNGRFATINFEADLPKSIYQISYFPNVSKGESVINMTNDGSSGGNICVNAYAYSADEQLVSCCTCLVSPNGLNSLKVGEDLLSNPLTPIVPNEAVVALVASTPIGDATCNAALPGSGAQPGLASGLVAWGTKIHEVPNPAGATIWGVTETKFHAAIPSAAALSSASQLCGFIKANGLGHGICKSCRLGGLGAGKK